MSASSNPVLEEALARFTRLRAGAPTAQQLDELEQWLDASPEHRDAYDDVVDHWTAMDALRSDSSLMFMREAARRDLRRSQWTRAARAASVVAAVGLALFGATYLPRLYDAQAGREARDHARTFSTTIGEVTQVRLTDGTQATLDTDTVIRAWHVKDARFVELVRGRARFKVAKDAARPFSVLVRDEAVIATGTDFDVYLRGDALRVTLAEGRVRVKTGPNRSAIDMTPGYQLTSSQGGWALAPADTDSNLSWSSRQLTFDENTLGEIAAELNRYSAKKMVIDDPAVASLRMSAVIRTTDTQAFLRAMEALSLARVRETGERFEIVPR